MNMDSLLSQYDRARDGNVVAYRNEPDGKRRKFSKLYSPQRSLSAIINFIAFNGFEQNLTQYCILVDYTIYFMKELLWLCYERR